MLLVLVHYLQAAYLTLFLLGLVGTLELLLTVYALFVCDGILEATRLAGSILALDRGLGLLLGEQHAGGAAGLRVG